MLSKAQWRSAHTRNGGVSCDITVNHIKECYLSASTKHWSRSRLFPLAFTTTASISLGENIFLSLRSLIAIFLIDIYAVYFRLPDVGRLLRPTFAENDNLITIDMHSSIISLTDSVHSDYTEGVMILQLILSSGCPHKKLLPNSRGHGPNKFLHLQSNFLSGLPVL